MLLYGKMFAEASKEGLNFTKYSENVAKNIKIAQNYTFKNGLRGLENMAKKATAMKMDMQAVAQLADKVSTVEGSIDVASKLQVLGGSFAAMADPIAMLNEGYNDIEGLQDRMIKMIGGMGTFNKETGEVTFTGGDRRRIRVAADAMGVSYDTLMESATAQVRRGEIEKQINSSKTASGLDKDLKELIMNTGTFKDGKAGVVINGEFKALDDIKGADYEAIKTESRQDSDNIKDIAHNLRSIEDVISGTKKAKDAAQAKMVKGIAKTYGGVIDYLGQIKGLLYALVVAQAIGGVANFVGNFRGFRGTARGSANRMAGNSTTRVPGKIVKGGVGRTLKRAGLKIFGKNVVKKGGNLFKGALNVAGNVWGGTKNIAGNAWKGTKNIAGNVLKNASKAVEPIKEVAKKAGGYITKATGGIVKGGVGRTLKRAGLKIFGKNAVKGITTVGGKLATGAAKGGIAGIGGAIVDIGTDALVNSGKMKKGGVGHYAGSIAGNALSYGALGSMFGPWGTAIGAVIGAGIGIGKAGKARQERYLEEKGIKVKGDYNRRKLRMINDALEETGKLPKWVRKKLEEQGDHEILAKIDKKDAENKAKGKKYATNFMDTRVGSIAYWFSPVMGEVMSQMDRLSNKLIGKLQDKRKQEVIKPIPEKGLNSKTNVMTNGNKEIHIKTGPQDIKLNGTLNLRGQDGKSIDIIDTLSKDKVLLTSLSSMVSNEIKRMGHGSDVSRDF